MTETATIRSSLFRDRFFRDHRGIHGHTTGEMILHFKGSRDLSSFQALIESGIILEAFSTDHTGTTKLSSCIYRMVRRKSKHIRIKFVTHTGEIHLLLPRFLTLLPNNIPVVQSFAIDPFF